MSTAVSCGGEPAKSGKDMLGNYQWGWGWFPSMGRIFYSFAQDNQPYLLEIIYDKSLSMEIIETCRIASETVIATFQPVDEDSSQCH